MMGDEFVLFCFNELFFAVLGLRCCSRAFSCCGEWGILSSCGARASHVVDHRL